VRFIVFLPHLLAICSYWPYFVGLLIAMDHDSGRSVKNKIKCECLHIRQDDV